MAKDILVNTQSGDLLVSESTSQTLCWNVLWGKLFDSDEFEYMNIIVPSGYINDVYYKNNQFECQIKAEYYPVNSNFLARFITFDIAANKYVLLQKYNTNTPQPALVAYRATFTGYLQDAIACLLLNIDIDGEFKVLFRQYEDEGVADAIICSAKNIDFSVGNSDAQSAQLLARCASGKFYRYPTTGVDLTKYINSVAEHTDMVSSLMSQFKSDSKDISEAEFDSSTGDLQVVFSGTKEAEDENLTSVDLLDVELFKIADDDYVRSIYKSVHGTFDSSEYIAGLVGNSFMGIYDMGCSAELDRSVALNITSGMLDGNGKVVATSDVSYIATASLESGKLYAIDYDISNIYTKDGKWCCNSLFAIYTSNDKDLVYCDEPFETNLHAEYVNFLTTFTNRRCFIPLQDLVIRFYVGKSHSFSDIKQGVWPIVDKTSNYNSILGVAIDNITGKLSAIVPSQTDIKSVKVDLVTDKILIIKSNT